MAGTLEAQGRSEQHRLQPPSLGLDPQMTPMDVYGRDMHGSSGAPMGESIARVQSLRQQAQALWDEANRLESTARGVGISSGDRGAGIPEGPPGGRQSNVLLSEILRGRDPMKSPRRLDPLTGR
jgi:hypothetical protein